ncbi:predicted protein [Micromonas commoda]|uniref:Uncharacterized protein n=1 Tax=Micromonas commoda (strain RCC299 / NOUM17 / CCMP2709) TaxID=296587 RepID=C1E8D1_MICCC|nr:predicted protein [Micromonas commoda]ACO64131.1 predicted protein [Micromonas commoda]|eukprot:XP_002502873.1 predicted protein [Micromonas commoda]
MAPPAPPGGWGRPVSAPAGTGPPSRVGPPGGRVGPPGGRVGPPGGAPARFGPSRVGPGRQ